MDSGTLALWLVGLLWLFFVAYVFASARFMDATFKRLIELVEKHNLLGDDHETTQSHVKSLLAMNEAKDGILREHCDRLDKLDERVAGVEALLVSTVGQETEDFCRQMDALFEKMDESKPEPKEKPEQAEKLTLSEEYVGKFGKKGKK